MLSNKFFPYSSMQEINLDWILTKVKNLMRFLPDDGSVGQILRRTAHGAEWSNEQGGGGAVTSVNGQTGDVVLAIPDSTSDLINDSGFVDAAGAAAAAPVQKVNGQTGTVTINKTSVGLGNVANVLQYSASNPPPYPVTSVNGQTGAVSLAIPTDTSDLNNDSGFVDAAGAAAAAPVQSVNGQTGAVTVSAGSKVEELWRNTDTSVGFAAQTLPLPANNCDLFIVLAIHQVPGDITVFAPTIVIPGVPACIQQIQGKTNGYDGEISALIRRITASTQTSLTFTSCNVIDKNGNAYNNRNDLAVPYRIIGITY